MTKTDILNLRHGDVLHHVSLTNADGTPLRARVNGKCKTWVRSPKRFKLPMKHGFYNHFYITEDNSNEWGTE